MRFKFFMRRWTSVFAVALLSLLAAAPASAQEAGVPQVLDEVIAQVNDQVITLSMLKREMKEAAEAWKQTHPSLTEQQAEEELAKRQPEIIATLINEQLLLQKGKELGLTEEVEAEVNKRMLAVGQEQGLKTIESLEKAMRAESIDPAAVRQTLRTEIMKNYVLGQEVDRKIFLGLTSSEVKSYYEAHKDKFRKPETMTLSEIFLSAVGKNEAEVRARAQQLVAQLRGGADFGAIAAVQSEREQNGKRVAPETKGKLGTFAVSDIKQGDISIALKNLKAGGVSDPIHTEQGFMILRVDERSLAGEPTFDENKVREAITLERLDKEHENYLVNLRREAYIKLATSYEDAVQPFLKTNTGATVSSNPPPPAEAPKKESKKKSETKKP